MRARIPSHLEVFNEANSLLSTYVETSELSLINQSAGIKPVAVSEKTLTCVDLSLKYASASGGAFDPTVMSLVRLWGFKTGEPPANIPTDSQLTVALDSVGFKDVIIEDNTVLLDKPGMNLDLGGIAKGYAVDLCYRKLNAMNFERAVINLGGNIRCIGLPGDGTKWRIGVRNPFAKDKTIGILELSDGLATATSGNYERFVSIAGKRYAHIVDPRTGWPVSGMASVTVVSTNAIEADALSTALFVAGTAGSEAILKSYPACEALFIEDRKPLSISVTKGFLEVFRPSDIPIENIRVLEY